MDGLAFFSSSASVVVSISAASAASFAGNSLLFPSVFRIRRKREDLSAKKWKFLVSASEREEPKLNAWDQMELKFGQLLGEDPKLTMAKIMARKANPDASFAEVEKSFYKNKGKIAEIEEIPLDWSKSKEEKASISANVINLVRPVPKKGIEFVTNEKPTTPRILKKPSPTFNKQSDVAPKGRLPNVILRKPSSFYADDVEDRTSKVRLKPNLSLPMGNERLKEKFSDMTLLRKPEAMNPDTGLEKKEVSGNSGNAELSMELEEQGDGSYVNFTLMKKPEAKPEPEEPQEQVGDEGDEEFSEMQNGFIAGDIETKEESSIEMQHCSESSLGSFEEKTVSSDPNDNKFTNSNAQAAATAKASLLGKPQRLDQSVDDTSSRDQQVFVNDECHLDSNELRDSPLILSLEENDWNKAEYLLTREARTDVELISSSTRGFTVSFGSLIGFLPYRNLAAKWKFLAFESWLRRKGIDPSMYRQNLGVIGKHNVADKTPSPGSESDKTIKGEISSAMKLEDLLMIYDQEKQKFLSSFVGQKLKASVVMANRKSRKLIFSMRPRENEEEVEKKRSLMAKLRVGDVVKCCIKKITYFGIFCEVEGVPALIHQTEVSWDVTLDTASCFKIGQMVEAKVHQLDFALERIFLSLKEITPDPLSEALESVVGDHDHQLGGRLQAAELETEWPEVQSLIKELEQTEGIQSVSKGRFFLSPGLAPTFQVYMAPMFENRYKLLARSGNKVQELLVEASLSKEEMKSTIMSCTNRV